MQRRKFVTAAGGAITVSLAGCLGVFDDDGDDTGSPEGVTESYFDRLEEGDVEDAENILHPDAQLDPQEVFEIEDEVSIEQVDADVEVVLSDIDSQELAAFEPDPAEFDTDEDADIDVGPNELSEGQLDDVAADEEVALVGADLDVDIEADDEQVEEFVEAFFEETPAYMLTATDDDEWLLLDGASVSVSA